MIINYNWIRKSSHFPSIFFDYNAYILVVKHFHVLIKEFNSFINETVYRVTKKVYHRNTYIPKRDSITLMFWHSSRYSSLSFFQIFNWNAILCMAASWPLCTFCILYSGEFVQQFLPIFILNRIFRGKTLCDGWNLSS